MPTWLNTDFETKVLDSRPPHEASRAPALQHFTPSRRNVAGLNFPPPAEASTDIGADDDNVCRSKRFPEGAGFVVSVAVCLLLALAASFIKSPIF